MAVACFTFDHLGREGDEVGYRRVLSLLERLGLQATFFVEGRNGVDHPGRVARLADLGHEVGLHGWAHEDWAALPRDDARRLLEKGRDALNRAGTGVHVAGFRAPGGERGPHTATLLAELGFDYDASLGDDLVPRRLPEGVAHVPFKWSGVDGAHYLTEPPTAPDEVAAHWLRGAEAAAAANGLVTYVAHAEISGADEGRFAALASVVETLAADPRFELLTVGEVAAQVIARGS